MKSLKALLIVATVAAASTLTGCGSIAQVTERGQALRDANPAAYEAMSGEANYAAQNPKYNVHGS